MVEPTYIEGAPTLPIGYFYRLNPNGRTFGGPRETVEVCEYRSFLRFQWVKVHASAGVYRDGLFYNDSILKVDRLRSPELSAATRAYEYWMCI